MKYIFHITIAALLVSVFAVTDVAVAQITNNPYQQPNQYQPPLNEPNPRQQEQPPVNQPEPQIQPPEPVAPSPEQPTLYQGDAPLPAEPTPQVQPQETAPEVSLPLPAADSTTASQFNSSSPAFYLLYAAIIMLALFWFSWWRKLLKHKKTTDLPAEKEEGKKKEEAVCPTCGGKGTIIKKWTITAPCNHCKQTGRDICHHCGGSGRYNGGFTVPQTQEEVDSLMKCDWCGGKGFPKIVLPCCMCKGKKKEEAQVSYQEKCPICGGTGRVAR